MDLEKTSYLHFLRKYHGIYLENFYLELQNGFSQFNELVFSNKELLQENYAHLSIRKYNISKTEEVHDEDVDQTQNQISIVSSSKIDTTSTSNLTETSLIIPEDDYQQLDQVTGFEIKILIALFCSIPQNLTNQDILMQMDVSGEKSALSKLSRALLKLEKLGLIMRKDLLKDTRQKGSYLQQKGLSILHSLYKCLDFYFSEANSYDYYDQTIKQEELKVLISSIEELVTSNIKTDWDALDKFDLPQKHKDELEKIVTLVSLPHEIVKDDETEAEFWYILGQFSNKQTWYHEAEILFNVCIKKQEDFHEAWAELGSILLKLNRQDDAEEACRTAIMFQPSNDKAWTILGTVLEKQGRLDEAKSAYQTVTKFNKENVKAWASLGHIHFLQDQKDKAEQIYQKIQQLSPINSIEWGSLGQFYIDLRKFEEAKNAYEKAVELNPSFSVAWTNLGVVHYLLNDFEKAEKAHRNSVKADPNYSVGWNNIGFLMHIQKRLEEAEKAYENAVKLDPENSMALNNLGCVIHDRGNLQEAEKTLRKAIKLSPTDALIWYSLALVLKDMKKTENTINALKSAIANSNPDWEHRDDVEKILKELQIKK